MSKRFWGLARDQYATKQLGLSTDHTIFMMGNEGTHLEDLDEVRDRFDGELVTVDEVLEAVMDLENRVILPGSLHLVGVKPFDSEGPSVYGVVDFKDFVEPENDE